MTVKRVGIKERQVQVLKYFKAISGMLESLHDAGCERDRAGNRILHMDQYMSLILLYMFNPICTDLRSIQRASELKNVQKKLKCSRASLGSLSEAASVFDSSLMQEIVENLSQKLKPISSRGKLEDISGILTAVDGTVVTVVLIIIHGGPRRSRCRWYQSGVCLDFRAFIVLLKLYCHYLTYSRYYLQKYQL